MKLIIDSRATSEIHKAASWYDGQKNGLGNEFVAEVDAAFLRISNAPKTFSQIETLPEGSNVRRMVLKRFPYAIIYEAAADFVRILAVSHVRRRPNYWSKRR